MISGAALRGAGRGVEAGLLSPSSSPSAFALGGRPRPRFTGSPADSPADPEELDEELDDELDEELDAAGPPTVSRILTMMSSFFARGPALMPRAVAMATS